MARLPQAFRFLLLGGLAAAINWVARFPLALIMPFEASVLFAYLIGMSAGFTLYRTYVFPGSDRPLLQQTITFLVVNLVGAAIVMAVAAALLALLAPTNWPDFVREGLAHGFAIGVGSVANFFGHKLLTFRISPSPDGQ
ncbi:MAG: sugar translocase [Pelagibacterium sp. SCN 63-23]|nr:MAG: sugar translocase [Pelagibacterium sp. SCN 63-23]